MFWSPNGISEYTKVRKGSYRKKSNIQKSHYYAKLPDAKDIWNNI